MLKKKKTKSVEQIQQMDQVVAVMQKKKDADVQKRKDVLEAERRPAENIKAERKLKQKTKKLKIPKTVQESIPYSCVYPDSGIIETSDGVFTKSYLLDDVNYQIANPAEQETMFLRYADLLNSFEVGSRFQITINQQARDIAEFEAETMLDMKNDGLDDLRVDQNKLLRGKIRAGKNELTQSKHLTVALPAQTYEEAQTAFFRMDTDIIKNVKQIGGARAEAMSTAKRLELLHDIYNPDAVGLFGNNFSTDDTGNPVFKQDRFRFDIMQDMGLTTKDMIAPESFSFRSDYGMVGPMYFRALFLKTFPTSLKDVLLKDITDIQCKMVVSLDFEPIEPADALKSVRDNMLNINASLSKFQRKASTGGYSVELISPELKDAAQDASNLRDDLTKNNQKMFHMTFVLVHFARDKETLDNDTKMIQGVCRRHLMDLRTLSWQQENGLTSCLPLCRNTLEIKRSVITESAAVFMPFVNQEINEAGGIYYGVNAVSHNLILLNRRQQQNSNGMFLGAPGSGKSMLAKQEMESVILSSPDQVIVIDPDGEYKPVADLLHGEVIRIAPGGNVHLNPFDIDMDLDSEDDPITIKTNLVCSICDAIMGGRYGLTAGQLSIIDRCVTMIYRPYLDSYDPDTGKYDNEKTPTLRDFYKCMREQEGYEAMQLADALEIYCVGSQDLFAHRTNVDVKKRFIVFDIKDIGSSLKVLGELVVLNLIWNHIVSARRQGRIVWFYVDEMHILFKNQQSAEFLRDTYKRARKYGGIPTGITQNVSDLLDNEIARTMILNCEFITMLNQSAMDRAQLGELLNISPTQLDYITNADSGSGLIFNGKNIVPFINELPKDTRSYEAMTTKLSEVRQLQQNKAAEPNKETPHS